MVDTFESITQSYTKPKTIRSYRRVVRKKLAWKLYRLAAKACPEDCFRPVGNLVVKDGEVLLTGMTFGSMHIDADGSVPVHITYSQFVTNIPDATLLTQKDTWSSIDEANF